MNLLDIVRRKYPIRPWESGEKIPWNEPEFSKRMLENHLSQEHDWASRRSEIIRAHVDFIAGHLHSGAKILDLGCGPGLYLQELAKRGFLCTGVDFSPASIAHAREKAESCNLDVQYFCSDIRSFHTDQSFDCILFTFGEFNVFREEDGRMILEACKKRLAEKGLFFLEVHTPKAVQDIGLAGPSWYSSESGLFSEKPHMLLEEHGWDGESATASTRYLVIEAESGETEVLCSSMKAYEEEEYRDMFSLAGFREISRVPDKDWPAGEFFSGKLKTYLLS